MLCLSEFRRKLKEHCGRDIPFGTVSKWVYRGVRGIVLKSRMIGGLRCVEWNDYLRWQAAVEKEDAARKRGPARRRKRKSAAAAA
ncbi:MAG: hypothetical protein ACYC3I_06440 [Gemmataceae bacterium]